jgi:AraC-like DNA-binding protein
MTMNIMLAPKMEMRDADCRGGAARAERVVARPMFAENDDARPAALRRRFKAGQIDFDYRAFPHERTVSLVSTETMVRIAVPVTGSAIVVSEDETVVLGTGSALLSAAACRTTSIWAPGSSAVFLDVPRAVIQAHASRMTGEPRRLAAFEHIFRWSSDLLDAVPFPAAFCANANPFGAEEVLLGRRVLASLVEALQADPAAPTLFPVARSVRRAVDHIRADPQHASSIHDLAQVAGVTAGTLRRNFRACLGVTVTQLAQQLRLEWVRSRLESPTESRAIGDLALAAGFGASGMLTRAYQRRFGETPSQTRARAFATPRD